MASVLLTGASGYLGTAIALELRRRGIDYDELPCRLENLPQNSLRGYQKIVHAAGALRLRDQTAIDRSNRIGTMKLLAALDGAPSTLFISSRAVYGHQPGRTCSEQDLPQPADFYAETKLAAEQAISESGLPHTILRVSRLIGESPAGIGHGFYAKALRQFLAGETVCRYTPDRLDDSLDVCALAGVCADWACDSIQLPEGVINMSGQPRSLHGILADFAEVAERFGGRSAYEDRIDSSILWPFMSCERFRLHVGPIKQRTDAEIAAACFAKLLNDRT